MSHSLHIRDFPEELARVLKLKAYTSGMSMKDFVIGILEHELRLQGGGTGRRGTPRESGNSGSTQVSRGEETPSSNAGSNPAPATKAHDPKTCKLYGCGMCKVLKEGR